jgi:hypothetical protein
MSIIDNIKKFLAERSIHKVLTNQTRNSYYPDFKDIKTVLILFKSDEDEKNGFIREIIAELKSEGKKVTVWGYLDKKLTETPILPDFRLFSNKELTFYKIPKPLLVNEFTHVEYDIVIQLSAEDILPLDYLLAQANSQFKVSKNKSYKGVSDFMIELDETADDAFLYEKIMFYLKSIQAKN